MSQSDQTPNLPPLLQEGGDGLRRGRKLLAAISAGVLVALVLNEYRISSALLGEGTALGGLVLNRSMIWVGALSTLAVYSFLIRDNPFYQAFEHALLGCATGMSSAIIVQDVLISKWWAPMSAGFAALARNGFTLAALGGALMLLPGLLGLMWYFQYSRRHFWVSRIPVCIGLGAGAGLGVKGLFNTLLPQITGSFKTLWPGAEFVRDASFWDRFAVGAENLIYVVGTVSVLTYFFFAFGRKHWGIRAPAKLGRWYLMLSLGAFFGNTFMSRLSALIERIHFLFSEWLRWSSL